jgi:hypothetical protein
VVVGQWQIVGTLVCEGEPVDLEGLNPWKHEWRRLDEPPVIVPHPSYPRQCHQLRIYEIDDGHKVVRFAAGEFSNGAFGFFLPTGALG